ncbi:hypothetical protein [Komagataeibacter rhaeticus]|uniref:hypothetical protein n=1 Tax=Komagataeibacter rhaeticus TaxID=215221 RepID=UPI0039EAD1A2
MKRPLALAWLRAFFAWTTGREWLPQNNLLIKNKSFWVPPFFKKAAFPEAFWKGAGL